MTDKEYLQSKMRIIEDFPAKGISYKDITTILEDKKAFKIMTDMLAKELDGEDFDAVVGIDARGFILGAALCYKLGKSFIMARKPGKLPGNVISEDYTLEYGKATIEVDKDTLKGGRRVVVVDDLMATGGTAKTVCRLVEKAGGKVVMALFLTELESIGGRKDLENSGYRVKSIIKWDH